MKLSEPPIDLIAAGSFPEATVWQKRCADVEDSIAAVVWLPGND